MSDSILTSIKKLLGIAEDYTYFDSDVMMYINTVFMILYQLGVGPSTPFSISDSSATWSDFLSDATDLEAVKTYISQKVRTLGFDVPQSSSHIEALNKSNAELEWRLNVTADPALTFTASEDEVNSYAIANRAAITAFEQTISKA